MSWEKGWGNGHSTGRTDSAQSTAHELEVVFDLGQVFKLDKSSTIVERREEWLGEEIRRFDEANKLLLVFTETIESEDVCEERSEEKEEGEGEGET